MACYIPKRYILVALGHFGCFVFFALNANLSVTIVAMVNQTYAAENKNMKECTGSNETEISTEEDGEFKWDQNQQGLLLSSFYYGYLFTQIPGGWVANRYGSKWVLSLGLLLTSILTAVTPAAAYTSFYLLLAIRVLIGIGEGVVIPSMQAIIAQWVPEEERGRLSTIIYAGIFSGTILTYELAGILAKSSFLNGWPSLFYILALIGFVWFALWTYLISNTPKQHPTISDEEKRLIASSLKETTTVSKNLSIPWKAIFTSIHFWAINVAHICKNWVWFMILTGLPSYFKNVLNFNLKANGLLSSLPFVVGLVIQLLSGWLNDWMLLNGRFSKKATRRIITFIGFYPSAVLLILASYTRCDQIYLSVTCMVIATGLLTVNNVGYFINDLDIAPRFSGVLMGIKNCLGSIPGCIAPLITGYLTNEDPSRENYRKVFILAACICGFGGTFFEIFLSGEEQPWNNVDKNFEMKEKETNTNQKYKSFK